MGDIQNGMAKYLPFQKAASGDTDEQTGATANFQGEIDTFRISPDRRSSATRMP